MRHRVNGPRPLAGSGERLAAYRFGLRVQVALFQAERVHAQHVGLQRVVFRPLGQHAGNTRTQLARVATVKIEQVRAQQRQQVARVLAQQRLPRGARIAPAARQAQLGGGKMALLAGVRVHHQRPRRVEIGACLRHQGGFGQGQQEVGLHQAREAPTEVGVDRGVEVGDWVAVERHQAPQSAFGVGQCFGRAGADGAVARVVHVRRRRVQCTEGSGQARCAGRKCSQARATCNTPRSSKRWPMICRPIGKPLAV